MAFPGFDALEKLINEHGSAAIMRDRLELAKDEYEALERKLKDSEERATKAEGRVTELEREVEGLKAAVRQYQEAELAQVIGLLPPDIEKVLAVIADHHSYAPKVADLLGISTPRVLHYFEELRAMGYVELWGHDDSPPDEKEWHILPGGLKYLATRNLI